MARFPTRFSSDGPGEVVVSFTSRRRRRRRLPTVNWRLPAATTFGGSGLALLILSWVAGMLSLVPYVGDVARLVSLPAQAAGAALIMLALVRMLLERTPQTR